MKRLTAIFPDDADINLADIIKESVYFCLQEEPKNGTTTNDLTKPIHKYTAKKNFLPGRTVSSTIMEKYSPGGMFWLKTAAKWVTKYNYAPNSASSQLHLLIKNGYVGRMDDGRYKFIKPMDAID